VPDQERHVSPCFESRHWSSADEIPHDVRIGAQLVVILEVTQAILAQNEPLSLQSQFFHDFNTRGPCCDYSVEFDLMQQKEEFPLVKS
jgi:hypothetical protein